MLRYWVSSPDYRLAIDAIKAVRIELGLSQRELARRLNKPSSFLSKIELLERRLDILEFIAIAKMMGLEPHSLLLRLLAVLPDEFKI